jgi:hypothetical protein
VVRWRWAKRGQKLTVDPYIDWMRLISGQAGVGVCESLAPFAIRPKSGQTIRLTLPVYVQGIVEVNHEHVCHSPRAPGVTANASLCVLV